MCVFYCFAAAGVQSVILTQDDLVSGECQSLTSSALSADMGTSWEICFFNFNVGYAVYARPNVFMELLMKWKWIRPNIENQSLQER